MLDVDRDGGGDVSVAPVRELQPASTIDRSWVDWAIGRLQADARRSADTHLLRLPSAPGATVDLYLKDESTHTPPGA
jgi:cysteine synthase A